MYTPSWDPYCPQGGQFYACGNGTKFVGCCDYTNPCIEEGGCSAGNLRQTSFPVAKYGTFADQQCDAGLFYTCTGTTPDAWWGCCTTNPCANNGCPRENMAAAFLSNNPADAAGMDPYPPVQGQSNSTSSSSSMTTSASSTSTTNSSATLAAVASPSPSSDSKSVPVGAIAGGAVGGFALLCAIIAIIWLVRRHARKSSEKHNSESRVNTAPELTGTSGGDTFNKGAMTEVTAMGSPYKDSPSTVPPYSNQTSPAPHYQSGGWSNQQMQQQAYAQVYPIQEAEARSQFKAYSPNDQGGNYSPYGPPQQFSPSLSQTSDPMHSATWANSSMGVSPRAPATSQYNNQGFARVHQGPPQEMGGDGYGANIPPGIGLGVHHIGNGDSFAPEPPRAELDAETGSPTQPRTDGSRA